MEQQLLFSALSGSVLVQSFYQPVFAGQLSTVQT